MKSEALTAKQVQFIKAAQTRSEVPAGPPKGLYLVIQPTGAKSWALRYRWHGMTRKLTLGTYPDMSLGAARGDAEARLVELERGTDPAAELAIEKAQSNPDSAGEVAEEWLKRSISKNTKPRTQREIKWILDREVLPAWKHKLITEISRNDVLRLLDVITDRGAPILANRTLAYVRWWLNWCVERGILQASPAAGIEKPTAEKSRERVLEDDEVTAIWDVAGNLGYPSGPFLKVLLLSAQRRGEVATMRWQDVDLERRIWALPSTATKARRPHDVPLSSQLVALIGELPRFEGPYVFSTTSGRKAINGFSKMKARCDKTLKDEESQVDDWTMHDFRRTASTWLAGAGVPPHILGALLNHTPGKIQGITSIYNRFRYVEERRAALEKWAGHLARLTEQKNKTAMKAG